MSEDEKTWQEATMVAQGRLFASEEEVKKLKKEISELVSEREKQELRIKSHVKDNVKLGEILEIHRKGLQEAKKELDSHRMLVAKEIHFKDGEGLTARYKSDIIQRFASAWIEIFKDNDAENCLEIKMYNKEVGHFFLSIQKEDGKTPFDLREEALEEIKDLKREIAKLKGEACT